MIPSLLEQHKENNYSLMILGIGGIANFIVPQLNDFYYGFRSKYQEWINIAFNKVSNFKEQYIDILVWMLDMFDKLKNKYKSIEATVILECNNKKRNLLDFFNDYLTVKYLIHRSMAIFTKDRWDGDISIIVNEVLAKR